MISIKAGYPHESISAQVDSKERRTNGFIYILGWREVNLFRLDIEPQQQTNLNQTEFLTVAGKHERTAEHSS